MPELIRQRTLVMGDRLRTGVHRHLHEPEVYPCRCRVGRPTQFAPLTLSKPGAFNKLVEDGQRVDGIFLVLK
jgi:hypothetical protein